MLIDVCTCTMYMLITHTGIAAGVGRAFSRVCLSVRALTTKQIPTPNLIHVYSIAVARHASTQRSKGQRSRSHGYKNRHGRMVASDHVQYSVHHLYAAVLPAAVADMGLHVDTTAYVF